MADGLTITGLTEFKAAVQALPSGVRLALKRVAEASANRIQLHARTSLRAQQKTAAHALADAIELTEEPEQYTVTSHPPASEPANVTLWNEYGTSKMDARPYMRPAADAERAAYLRDSEAAVVELLQKGIGS